MARWSLAGLLAELETSLSRIRKSAEGFLRALGPKAQAPAPRVTQFGEYERVEEAKFFPPTTAPPLDEGVVPERYGKSRLVLLPVDPYLIHAYWELTPYEAAARSNGTQAQQAVIRFYDTSGAAEPKGEWFDIEVALEPGNWQVRLWSPQKSYVGELGVRGKDGSFVPLVRSNAVHTPRAWPATPVEEHFVRAPGTKPEPTAARPPLPKRAPLQPLRLQKGDAPWTIDHAPATAGAASRAPATAEGAATTTRERAIQPRSRTASPTPIREQPIPGGSAELLQKKLAELYAFREAELQAQPEIQHPPPGIPSRPPSSPGAPGRPWSAAGIDLTRITEEQFQTGISSPIQPERRPES